MDVKIGSARIDERGKARGGQAGDQTGREVSTQNWYDRWANPWVVLRPKQAAHAERIARCMEMACANQRIGYDQGGRDTLYSAAAACGFDVSKITKPVETDCSALVRVCCAYAGIAVRNFRTTDEAAVLMATGLFEKLTAAKYIHSSAYLRRGDILVTQRQGHTVVVLSDGAKAEDSPTPAAPVQMPAAPELPYMANWVRATGDVNVRTGPGTRYPRKIVLLKDTALPFDGAVSGEWYAVQWRGKRHWVSSRYSEIAVLPKHIVDLSVYDDVRDWDTFCASVSYVWLRVGLRSLTSAGSVKKDAKFDRHAAELTRRGVPFGVYFYGRAKTAAGAVEEADAARYWAERYGPTTYVYDVETPTNTREAVQAFIDRITERTGRPCGLYIGHRWSQVSADKIRRAFTWCPYYRANGGGTHGDRDPSHPHDVHQYSCSARVPGKADDTDVSHISGTGVSIEWLRTGGKAVGAS